MNKDGKNKKPILNKESKNFYEKDFTNGSELMAFYSSVRNVNTILPFEEFIVKKNEPEEDKKRNGGLDLLSLKEISFLIKFYAIFGWRVTAANYGSFLEGYKNYKEQLTLLKTFKPIYEKVKFAYQDEYGGKLYFATLSRHPKIAHQMALAIREGLEGKTRRFGKEATNDGEMKKGTEAIITKFTWEQKESFYKIGMIVDSDKTGYAFIKNDGYGMQKWADGTPRIKFVKSKYCSDFIKNPAFMPFYKKGMMCRFLSLSENLAIISWNLANVVGILDSLHSDQLKTADLCFNPNYYDSTVEYLEENQVHTYLYEGSNKEDVLSLFRSDKYATVSFISPENLTKMNTEVENYLKTANKVPFGNPYRLLRQSGKFVHLVDPIMLCYSADNESFSTETWEWITQFINKWYALLNEAMKIDRECFLQDVKTEVKYGSAHAKKMYKIHDTFKGAKALLIKKNTRIRPLDNLRSTKEEAWKNTVSEACELFKKRANFDLKQEVIDRMDMRIDILKTIEDKNTSLKKVAEKKMETGNKGVKDMMVDEKDKKKKEKEKEKDNSGKNDKIDTNNTDIELMN